MSTIKTTVEHSPQQRHGGYELPLMVLGLVSLAALGIVAYGNGYIHFGGQSGEVTRVTPSTAGDGVTIADLDKVHDKIAPLFDRLTAAEKKIEAIAPIVGEMTKLTTAVNAVVEKVDGLATKADVSAVNTRVDEVSAAVETNRVAVEEKIARLHQLYEELKATLASNPEPVVSATLATPVAEESPVELKVAEEETSAVEPDPAVVWLDNIAGACPNSNLTIDQARSMSEEELREYLGQCLVAANSPPEPSRAVVVNKPVRLERPITTTVTIGANEQRHPFVKRPDQYRCWVDKRGGRHRVSLRDFRATGWCIGPAVND